MRRQGDRATRIPIFIFIVASGQAVCSTSIAVGYIPETPGTTCTLPSPDSPVAVMASEATGKMISI